MTTDEMLIEIVSHEYKCSGFPYVFMDFSQSKKAWSITWRNPIDFENKPNMGANTPNKACKKALQFIKDNPTFFNKRKL